MYYFTNHYHLGIPVYMNQGKLYLMYAPGNYVLFPSYLRHWEGKLWEAFAHNCHIMYTCSQSYCPLPGA